MRSSVKSLTNANASFCFMLAGKKHHFSQVESNEEVFKRWVSELSNINQQIVQNEDYFGSLAKIEYLMVDLLSKETPQPIEVMSPTNISKVSRVREISHRYKTMSKIGKHRLSESRSAFNSVPHQAENFSQSFVSSSVYQGGIQCANNNAAIRNYI